MNSDGLIVDFGICGNEVLVIAIGSICIMIDGWRGYVDLPVETAVVRSIVSFGRKEWTRFDVVGMGIE